MQSTKKQLATKSTRTFPPIPLWWVSTTAPEVRLPAKVELSVTKEAIKVHVEGMGPDDGDVDVELPKSEIVAVQIAMVPDGSFADMRWAPSSFVAVASEKVVSIFEAAGLKTPDISILSDEFLEEVRGLPHKNLAVEVLRKLLNGEIKTRSKMNLIESRRFSEMLEKTIRAYQNRTIEAAAVIAELIDLAKEMREAHRRGEKLRLSEEELAFYDALEVNDSAVKVLGDETLRVIAHELVETVRNNVSIDWTVKESVRAKLRSLVKRILRKYGYPPDKQDKATQTVLEQAELIAKDWAA